MSDKGKTILILGNGFDLAHGLPTKYSHFVEFCERVEMIWRYGNNNRQKTIKDFKERWINRWETDVTIKDVVEKAFRNRKINYNEMPQFSSDNKELSEIHNLLDDNIWYEYFKEIYEKRCMKGENWIDFEAEIRFIIKTVDEKALSLTNLWDDVIKEEVGSLKNPKLNIFKQKIKFEKYKERKRMDSNYEITVKEFREKIFEDLERLTRALEIYLDVFVRKIQVSNKIQEIDSLTPDYVINFNYTDTYEKLYKKGEVYHIHGKADAKRSIEENNMVLGIDEYWSEDERDERTNFTIFKKFSQRIQKHTGNESYKYLQEIRKLFKDHSDCVSYVYVFGHSLDVTDKDILSSYIGDDSTSVIVYCMDRGTEGELIANTIKLISEKRLIDKSNHVPTKLDYVIQKNK